MALELNKEQREKIFALIKDVIKELGNCRVGWAIKEVAGKEFEKSLHNIEKIANTIIQSGEYIKEPSLQVTNDFNILKNSQYKLTQINKCSVIINTIIAFLTLIAMIISIIFAQQAYIAKELSEQKVENQSDYFSKNDNKENFPIDSLSDYKIDSVSTREKNILQKKNYIRGVK